LATFPIHDGHRIDHFAQTFAGIVFGRQAD